MLESLKLITDPWFFAVAVPAVLLVGLSRLGVLLTSFKLLWDGLA